MDDIAKTVQSWIPDGDGYNSEYALQMQDVITGIDELRTKLEACQAHNVELRDAAIALIERWDTPNWKDAEHTGVFIARLRDALSSTHTR